MSTYVLKRAVLLVSALILFTGQPAGAVQARRIDAWVGRWVAPEALNEAPIRGGMIGPGFSLTLGATETRLTAKSGSGTNPMLVDYGLDGSVTETSWHSRPARSRLSWAGDVLVLEVWALANETNRDTWRLTRTDDRLTLNASTPLPSGRTIDFVVQCVRGPASVGLER